MDVEIRAPVHFLREWNQILLRQDSAIPIKAKDKVTRSDRCSLDGRKNAPPLEDARCIRRNLDASPNLKVSAQSLLKR